MSRVDWYSADERAIEVLRRERGFVPENIFPTVRQWSSSPTVDPLCVREVDGKKQFLLTRRTEKPWKGRWFIPGGRVKTGEHPVAALERICYRELGIRPSSENTKFVDWHPLLNPEDEHGGEPYFTLMTLFTVNLGDNEADRIKLDRTASEMKWFDHIEPSLPDPVKKILQQAGFK